MKILVIGAGSIGKRHIKNLQKLNYKKIDCLEINNPELIQTKFKINTYTSYSELGPYDCVFICTPTSLHNEGLRYAVDNNCAIFMEKPLIHSSQGLNEARNILRKNNNIFFIGFMMRFHKAIIKIKEIIENNTIGKILSSRLEFGYYLPYWHPDENYHKSYAAIKNMGGGVINTINHEIDLMQYFFGSPKFVYCIKKNFKLLNIEVEELCESCFEYDDKIVSIALDYLQKDYHRSIKIVGSEGVITWKWKNNYIMIKRYERKNIKIRTYKKFDVNQLYISELKHFMSLVENNTIKHSLDSKHAFMNTELLFLMHQSSTDGTRKAVPIEYS